MKPIPPQSLSSLLGALASQAIPIQQALDHEWREAAERHMAMAQDLKVASCPTLAELHQAIAPARLVADRLDFSLSLRLRREQRHGFELKAAPLNLGFAWTHRESVETSTRVRFQVEAVPLPAKPA